MIEQYFRPGVRFLWHKPDNVDGPRDATIVASRMAAATIMTYDGLDGHQNAVDPVFVQTNSTATLGLAMGQNVGYSWLDYVPGRTSYVTLGGGDVLTGFMSGCLICRGTYGGAMSAFHVGTVEADPDVNYTVKKMFAHALPNDATGFNPAGAWNLADLQGIMQNLETGTPPKIMALVTAAGAFYSVAMVNVTENNANAIGGREYWCIGDKRPVPAMSRVDLLHSLLS